MAHGNLRQINVPIYPNQLAWMERISKILSQSKRHTFLECFACYIGEFKQAMRRDLKNNGN
jgi:hypothetical protein